MDGKNMLECLIFTVNQKVDAATKKKLESTTEKEQCYQQGQIEAFNEVYSLLKSNLPPPSKE